MLHNALDKGQIVEVLICWMGGVDEEFLDPDGIAGVDNARRQHALRQGFHNLVLQLSIKAVRKNFEDEERLFVNINCIGNIG